MNSLTQFKKTPILPFLIALALVAVAAAPAVATPPSGVTTEIFGVGTFDEINTYAKTGDWKARIDNGSHHLAFGYNALMLVSFSDGVYVFSGFGDTVTATLNTNATPATFSWHVELGVSCPDQNPYDSLTFFGVASRGGG